MADTAAPAAPVLATPRGRRLLGLLVAAVLVGDVILSTTMSALTPTLLRHHSVVLELLLGSSVAIVTTAALARDGHAVFLAGLLSPFCAILIYDLAAYSAGRLWGNRLLGYYVRGSSRRLRWVTRIEAIIRRRGVFVVAVAYFLPLPNSLIYVLAGTSGMRLLVFLIGDMVGTLLWSGLLTSLGWSLGQHAVAVVNHIQHNAVVLTVGVAVVLVGAAVVRERKARGGARSTSPR